MILFPDLQQNACSSNPCPPNSRCVERDNKYRCKCKDGFEGKVCESGNVSNA